MSAVAHTFHSSVGGPRTPRANRSALTHPANHERRTTVGNLRVVVLSHQLWQRRFGGDLARAMQRERELAVRATLGADIARLVRQLLTEHVALAALGAVAGLLLAFALVRGIPALGPIQVPRLNDVAVDGRVAGFAALLALATGVAFGLWPARHAGRVGVAAGLKQTARTVVGGGVRARARRVLVTAEIALSLILLVGAALLIVSLQRVLHVDPGFEPDHLLTARLNLPQAQYGDPERTRRFVHQVAADVASLPGIRSAGITTTLPLGDGEWGRMLTLDDRPAPASFAEVPLPDHAGVLEGAGRRST